MSTKILTQDRVAEALPIVWKRVDPPLRPDAAPAVDASENEGPHGCLGTSDYEARIQSLQSEIVSREARARTAGRAEGEAAAKQALEAPLKEAIGLLTQQLQELSQVRTRLRRDAERDLVKLGIEIARRILRRELSTDPSAILGLVKAALERVDARDVFRVRAHPEDARTLDACLADLGMPERIEVVADQNLERGAVILETTKGQLDASVETQLQEIERGFADLVRTR